MTHTPGPWNWYWKLGENFEADCGVFSEATKGQAYAVCRCPRYQKEEQWKIDAPILAAANDLLEACEMLLADIEPNDSCPWADGSSVQIARAAIKKAKGEK